MASVSAGFSLLEVLIAGTLFSLGLAGAAALLLAAIIGSGEARREGIAATAAASLAEQIRLNRSAAERYLDPPEWVSDVCSGEVLCTPEQQADYDYRLWRLELADGIRGARALVCRDQTPRDGDLADGRCDGAGPLVIKIFWEARQAGDTRGPQQRRYTLEVS